MLIRYSDGRMDTATLLGVSNDLVRVALPRDHGSVEFARHNGQWRSDAVGPVEIDFTAAASERDWRRFCEHIAGMDERAPWDAQSLLAGCLPVPGEQACLKPKSFAIQLYERFARGESVEQIAGALRIPVEHVAVRIRAAECYLRRHSDEAHRV